MCTSAPRPALPTYVCTLCHALSRVRSCLLIAYDALVDDLARQAHVEWLAVQRAEKWVYGTSVDPLRKTHPYIRPYDELTSEQREVYTHDLRGFFTALKMCSLAVYELDTMEYLFFYLQASTDRTTAHARAIFEHYNQAC
jgi:hypothetical protein